MTSFHLEQAINEQIHLRKTKKGKKSAACAARCLRFEIFRKRFLSLHFDPLSHFIYMQVHDVFRNYLARMRAFDCSRSLLTVENRSQLTVMFFDWTDKNYYSISYTKNGVRRRIYWWLKTWLTIISSLVSVLICQSLLVHDASAVIGTRSSRVRIVVS